VTNYQLVKIIEVAGGVRSRKKLQKVIHLLRAGGCPLDVSFRLHYYGPYSSALAEQLDRLAGTGVLEETVEETQLGKQFSYALTDKTRQQLAQYETTPAGRAAQENLTPHFDRMRQLIKTPPRVLELASTLAEYYAHERNWDAALRETADFKAEPPNSANMNEAKQLAQGIVG
jgi:uncharacterized protein YwgA